jgi:hypothetical protein
MVYRVIIIIAILCQTSFAYAGSWDKQNTQLHIPYTALMVIDLGQTLYVVDSPKYKEDNQFIGQQPTREDVYTYFIATYILTTVLFYILPPEMSHTMQISSIVVEFAMVRNNKTIGVGIKF